MRKKELYNRYMDTFEELRRLKTENAEIIKELQEYKKINEQFKKQIVNVEKSSDNGKTVQENSDSVRKDIVDLNISLSEEDEYAAAAIANIVKLSVLYSNSIKDSSDYDLREFINLILGYTETAKMDILEIVLSDKLIQEKKDKIDLCENNAKEYFEKIINQIK